MAPRFSLVCYSVTQCPRFCFAAGPGGVSGVEINGMVLAGIRYPVRSGLLILSLVQSSGVGQWAVKLGSLNYVMSGKDRKSTRLNSSHVKISYAVFCLKKKK